MIFQDFCCLLRKRKSITSKYYTNNISTSFDISITHNVVHLVFQDNSERLTFDSKSGPLSAVAVSVGAVASEVAVVLVTQVGHVDDAIEGESQSFQRSQVVQGKGRVVDVDQILGVGVIFALQRPLHSGSWEGHCCAANSVKEVLVQTDFEGELWHVGGDFGHHCMERSQKEHQMQLTSRYSLILPPFTSTTNFIFLAILLSLIQQQIVPDLNTTQNRYFLTIYAGLGQRDFLTAAIVHHYEAGDIESSNSSCPRLLLHLQSVVVGPAQGELDVRADDLAVIVNRPINLEVFHVFLSQE